MLLDIASKAPDVYSCALCNSRPTFVFETHRHGTLFSGRLFVLSSCPGSIDCHAASCLGYSHASDLSGLQSRLMRSVPTPFFLQCCSKIGGGLRPLGLA